MLGDILLTYCFFNWDLGYAQGMNDLLVPVLLQMDDEVDAFWCFKALMETMAPNFHKDQTGMHSQLCKLEKLVKLMDPGLHRFLKVCDATNMFFCYRWLLVLFKRELSIQQTYILWEVLWSQHYHKEFHLFFTLAALVKHRAKIIDEGTGFDSILQFVSTLEEILNVEELLQLATSLYLNFEQTTDDEVKLSIFE